MNGHPVFLGSRTGGVRACPGARSRRRRAPFTLMEILVVLAILALITGLVLPHIGKLPEGLRVDTCIGVFENAFRDSALRARATGATVKLVLNAENNEFRLQEIKPSTAVPPPAADDASAGTVDGETSPAEGHYNGEKVYPLPNGIEWNLDQWNAAADGPPAFTFYPNGECSGLPIEFSTGNRKLRLAAEHLTAMPHVTDLNP